MKHFDRDWNAQTVKIKRVEGTGGFESLQVAADAIYAEPFCAEGADVGGAQEQWYLKMPARDLFYWKSRPVFFGGFTSQSRGMGQNTVLLLPRDDASGFDELIESCYGLGILDVATDGRSYAAVTDKVVVFGDFATAPDLP